MTHQSARAALSPLFLLLSSLIFLTTTTTHAVEVPFKLCAGTKDRLSIEKVDVDPLPVRPGGKVTITATATPDHKINKGTSLEIVSEEFGLSTKPAKFDVCELGVVECPVDAGTTSDVTFTYTVTKMALPGTATSTVKITDPDGKTLSCLQVEMPIAAGRRLRG